MTDHALTGLVMIPVVFVSNVTFWSWGQAYIATSQNHAMEFLPTIFNQEVLG